MSRHIYKCSSCNTYTMKESCTACHRKTELPRPCKYSPEDKYAKYRRIAKRAELEKRELL